MWKNIPASIGFEEHLKKIHPFKLSAVKDIMPRVGIKQKAIKNSLNNFKIHLIKVHKAKETGKRSVRKCLLCVFESSKDGISTYLNDAYNINYELENLEFDKWGTFITWKKQTEKRTRCKFILKRRKRATKRIICVSVTEVAILKAKVKTSNY